MPLYEIALLGAAQGFILILALLGSRYGNLRANRVLAAFIGVLSSRLLVICLEYRESVSSVEYGPLFLALHLSYTIGPLLYAYSRLLVEPGWQLRPAHAWHLLPVPIASLLLYPGGPLLDINPADYLSFEALPPDSRRLATLLSMPVYVSLGLYCAACLRLLASYRLRAREEFSTLDRINLHWLRALAWLCLGLAAVSLAGEASRAFLNLAMGPRAVHSVVFSVFLIYYIGLMGLRQPLIFEQQRANTLSPSSAPGQPIDVKAGTENEAMGSPAKYRNSGLSDEHLDRLWARLQMVMKEQRPYLQQGLKLAELAEIVGTRPNYLSQVINTRAGATFFDYINRKRVDHAQELLDEHRETTISEIALVSGFTSQNLFNGHFKKLTGQTPTQFRNRPR